MMGNAGRLSHQRSVEELVKSETGMGNGPGRGRAPGPPVRPRMWLGVAGLLGFPLVILLGLVLDCAGPSEPAVASPSPSAAAAYSPTGSTDQPPSTVMVWPVTARASGESR